MKEYYIFRGRGDCGTCSAHSGYYTVYPGRPHRSCKCEITAHQEKPCDGDWGGQSISGERDLGNGYIEQDFVVDVTQPDGSVDHGVVTVAWPADMDPDAAFDALFDALEDKAHSMSDPCPSFLCC